MTLTIPKPTIGALMLNDRRTRIGDADALIFLYLSDGKYGYLAYHGDTVFIQQPVYMSERKAMEEAASEIGMGTE